MAYDLLSAANPGARCRVAHERRGKRRVLAEALRDRLEISLVPVLYRGSRKGEKLWVFDVCHGGVGTVAFDGAFD